MARRTGKPLSPLEEQGRARAEQYLNVPVVQHDDNTGTYVPDLRIEYPDRPHAAMEIVRDSGRLGADPAFGFRFTNGRVNGPGC